MGRRPGSIFPFGGGALNEELEVSGLAGFEEDSYYSYGAFSHTYWKNPAAAAGLSAWRRRASPEMGR